MLYSQPSVSAVLRPEIQPPTDQKYSGKKNLESSKKQNLNLPCAGHYLYNIYIVLGSVNNLKMI